MAKTDRVAQFLYDINVELNLNYADPSRDLFPEFAPHYAQYPDLPVASRLTAALGKLANPAEVLKVQGVVTAALMRVTESAS